MNAALMSAICRLPLGARRRALVACTNYRIPNLRNPATFNDKVNWRILNDRRPLLEWTCDKLAMKEHARGIPGLHVPRTFWAGTDFQELASTALPEHWILKPNHRSGEVYFGHGRPDVTQLSAVTQGWLRPIEAERLGEWAYSTARSGLLAEEVIGTPGSPPRDYKFFVFDGDVAAVEVHTGRYSRHAMRIYRPDWSPLNVRCGNFELAELEPPPSGLRRMLAVAAALGSKFDFIRIDLYNVDGKIFFGEFTSYSGSGLDMYTPASYEVELGAKWTLPEVPRPQRFHPARPQNRYK
jgi:hypothetical protein